MKSMLLSCILVVAGLSAVAGAASDQKAIPRLSVGGRLPPLAGDLLTGKPGVLPDLAAGRTTLIALGFTYQSRFQVEAWAEKVRSRFGNRPDLGLFEVPMMGSAARLGRWFIDSGMRKNTPPALHGRVMTVYGGNGDWKTRVGFSKPDDAYLVLIDSKGVVRWMGQGAVTDDRVQELAALIDSLAATSPAPQ
jgi:hypothetical protein